MFDLSYGGSVPGNIRYLVTFMIILIMALALLFSSGVKIIWTLTSFFTFHPQFIITAETTRTVHPFISTTSVSSNASSQWSSYPTALPLRSTIGERSTNSNGQIIPEYLVIQELSPQQQFSSNNKRRDKYSEKRKVGESYRNSRDYGFEHERSSPEVGYAIFVPSYGGRKLHSRPHQEYYDYEYDLIDHPRNLSPDDEVEWYPIRKIRPHSSTHHTSTSTQSHRMDRKDLLLNDLDLQIIKSCLDLISIGRKLPQLSRLSSTNILNTYLKRCLRVFSSVNINAHGESDDEVHTGRRRDTSSSSFYFPYKIDKQPYLGLYDNSWSREPPVNGYHSLSQHRRNVNPDDYQPHVRSRMYDGMRSDFRNSRSRRCNRSFRGCDFNNSAKLRSKRLFRRFVDNRRHGSLRPPLRNVYYKPGPPYPGIDPRAPNKPLDKTVIHPSRWRPRYVRVSDERRRHLYKRNADGRYHDQQWKFDRLESRTRRSHHHTPCCHSNCRSRKQGHFSDRSMCHEPEVQYNSKWFIRKPKKYPVLRYKNSPTSSRRYHQPEYETSSRRNHHENRHSLKEARHNFEEIFGIIDKLEQSRLKLMTSKKTDGRYHRDNPIPTNEREKFSHPPSRIQPFPHESPKFGVNGRPNRQRTTHFESKNPYTVDPSKFGHEKWKKKASQIDKDYDEVGYIVRYHDPRSRSKQLPTEARQTTPTYRSTQLKGNDKFFTAFNKAFEQGHSPPQQKHNSVRYKENEERHEKGDDINANWHPSFNEQRVPMMLTPTYTPNVVPTKNKPDPYTLNVGLFIIDNDDTEKMKSNGKYKFQTTNDEHTDENMDDFTIHLNFLPDIRSYLRDMEKKPSNEQYVDRNRFSKRILERVEEEHVTDTITANRRDESISAYTEHDAGTDDERKSSPQFLFGRKADGGEPINFSPKLMSTSVSNEDFSDFDDDDDYDLMYYYYYDKLDPGVFEQHLPTPLHLNNKSGSVSPHTTTTTQTVIL